MKQRMDRINVKRNFQFFILVLCLCSSISGAQDSTKVRGRLMVNVQSWPDVKNAVRVLKADSSSAICINVWKLEEDSFIGSFKYHLKEAEGCAQIIRDAKNAHVFYVTPLAQKLSKKTTDQDVIKLEVWIEFEKKELYYFKAKQNAGLLWDDRGWVIPEKVIWVPMDTMFKKEAGMYWIGNLPFRVKP
jgi:hypothetical protein